jgi:hypothetical protein
VRLSRPPKLVRRGCGFPASGIAASLSDGGEVPALGVRGLLEETMLIGYESVADLQGVLRFLWRRQIAWNQSRNESADV